MKRLNIVKWSSEREREREREKEREKGRNAYEDTMNKEHSAFTACYRII